LELHKAALQKDTLQQYSLALRFICLLRGNQTSKQDLSPYIPQTLQTILDDINVNFASIKDLDYFAEKYFISLSTLQRLFKKHLHTTPKMYIETKRLAYSRQLLKQGVSVFDACMQAGFPDYSNYIRLFRNRFGMTPKRYQENK
jgi:methylphosphotriester-DNA--protein-cysteine methyltransferase